MHRFYPAREIASNYVFRTQNRTRFVGYLVQRLSKAYSSLVTLCFMTSLLLIRILQGVSLPRHVVVVYRRSLAYAGSHEGVIDQLTLAKSCDVSEDPITY